MKATALIDAEEESRFGGKAVGLARALRAGLPVPPGQALEVRLVEDLVDGYPEAREAVERALAELAEPVSVRSSAVGEDGQGSSFAGQHRTFLNLRTPAEVVAAIVAVHRSGQSAAARQYRERRQLEGPARMAVVLQRMIDPDTAGVLFTRDPIDDSDAILVESSWGLGEAVVSGLVTPDLFRLDREGRLLAAEIGIKDRALRRDRKGGIAEEAVEPARARAASLAERELRALHGLALRAEQHFGRALDLEWAIAQGSTFLLQSRPITDHRRMAA